MAKIQFKKEGLRLCGEFTRELAEGQHDEALECSAYLRAIVMEDVERVSNKVQAGMTWEDAYAEVINENMASYTASQANKVFNATVENLSGENKVILLNTMRMSLDKQIMELFERSIDLITRLEIIVIQD